MDPPGCTDIDDALHCLKLDEKHVQVGVHIADVTHFIRPGTAIDREAASRATTVYLVDNRIDMVPGIQFSDNQYLFQQAYNLWNVEICQACI